MARKFNERDIAPLLSGAEHWIKTCLVGDQSIFSSTSKWIPSLVDEVHEAFVMHPDFGKDDFLTKLKKQLSPASKEAKQLAAEMLWILLLFPSNMHGATKRQQIREIWRLSGSVLPEDAPYLTEPVLQGVGSGGPGFNNYRPNELEYLIALVAGLKRKDATERNRIMSDYSSFIEWIPTVEMKGNRQFRHMLRYFAFPDRVERISSNNDRVRILAAFGIKDTPQLSDRELDRLLFELRKKLEGQYPSTILDFYEAPLLEQWSDERIVKTVEGQISVTVPADDRSESASHASSIETSEPRISIQVQAKLARIGAAMRLNVWIPASDRGRVSEQLSSHERAALLEELPLNYESATLSTIENIDVIWIKSRSIVRAFEVEQTTAIYSGLLRMADLLALQPNMDIALHIVAPAERRERVFTEMKRPVFAFLERKPLVQRCSFLSYESVDAVNNLEHLAYTNESIVEAYEERAD